MEDKFLCLIATFDEETSKQMKKIEQILNDIGIYGKQTPNIPHHITIGYFDISQEDLIKELMYDVGTKTKAFKLNFNHIGLFGLKVMFLAPDTNYELLELHQKFEKYDKKHTSSWTPHATILIDEAENIQKALPVVANNFQTLGTKVESLRLYEFFPTRLIAEFNLPYEL